jgi:hypothetical protein
LASVQRKNPQAFLVSTQPNLIVRTPKFHLFGARFSSQPVGQKAGRALDLSKPKLSISKTARAAFRSRPYYFFRAEPLKITKSASSSTPQKE